MLQVGLVRRTANYTKLSITVVKKIVQNEAKFLKNKMHTFCSESFNIYRALASYNITI